VTLPNFVVIGAMKAGTVSLRHYLGEHPDVFLGRGGTFGERLSADRRRFEQILGHQVPSYWGWSVGSGG